MSSVLPVLVGVAVPVPFLGELTYRVHDGGPIPPIGSRVKVPLGTRVVTGCVVRHDAVSVDGEARGIGEVLDAEPFLSRAVIELCRWTADYYMAGIGDTIRMAMPPGAQRERSGFKLAKHVAVTAQGLNALSESDVAATRGVRGGPVLTSRQKDVLAFLAGAPAGVPMTSLRERGVMPAVIQRLVARGLATVDVTTVDRDPFVAHASGSTVVDRDRQLTTDQERALVSLVALSGAGRFSVALLHGVTGSGKTEVYLRLADHVVRSGRQVMLMVPEIALTPSVAGLFRSAFGARVAIQHSGLSDGERHDQWHLIRNDRIDVVIGTRSAVFAPLSRLGLTIVDEEHDSSYKQDELPRYHGRDVAIVRAQAEGALVVLGSATPSMESYYNATIGKYTLIGLSRRVLDRPLASVRLVNMREEYAVTGPDVVVSRALVDSIDRRLGSREQVVVLLNRRGYATSVFCRQCGDTFECPNCSVSLTMHTQRHGEVAGRPSAGGTVPAAPRVSGWGRCHYCNYSLRMPKVCRKCAAPYLEQAGFGTERVEQDLRLRFPDARIGRVDRDSVRRKGALSDLLARFARGDLDILVGTQMIAKGHDFPRVTLVGVVSADAGLGLADFRASERTFQLLTQVAGRSGRGRQTGEAVVQTLYPDHYSVQLARDQNYPEFFARELEFRRGMRYPPFAAMINVVVRGRTREQALEVADDLAKRIRHRASDNLVVLGPAPAPLGRLKGEYRMQMFLKGTRRIEMRQVLQSVLDEVPEVRRRVTVDVDPLNVL